jgi:pimeloyl-ACP methyl ester carboxylesterase
VRRIVPALLFLCILIPITGIQQARSQADEAQVILLDRTGQPVTSIVDGNQVQLGIKLPAVENSATDIDFGSPDLLEPLASCTIQAGTDGCETLPFAALGWYWSPDGSATPQRTVIASATEGQQIGSLSISVAPRPVVMVHGFNANYTTWTTYLAPGGYLTELGLEGFAVGDGQAPGVMETGSLKDPFKRTKTIAQNAGILGAYIDHVQDMTGAEKVDLLVHSMGGIISRYFIDRVMTEEDVAQLIILGSPMGGSSCAILPASLGMMLPATLEIQPSYMVNVFNQQIVHRKGVPFHALAGTKLLEAVSSPCTPVPSDVVVTLDSAKAIPMPVEEIPLLHTELNTSRVVFDGFVTHYLKTPPGDFEIAVDPPPGSTPPASQQFSRVYTGHLNPGETRDVIINIDPNVTVANFALFDTSRSLNIVVTGASGAQLALDPVENGVIRIDDPSTMIYLGYGFKQPRAGRWVVTLQTSSSTPGSGADFAIAAQFDGGALLQTTQDITIPRLHETVNLRGALSAEGAPVPLTTASAVIHKPDGSVETREMTLSGNQAELQVRPDLQGLYGVELNVLAERAEGNVVDRAAFLTFEVQPAGTEIAQNQVFALGVIVLVLLGIAILWVSRRRRV